MFKKSIYTDLNQKDKLKFEKVLNENGVKHQEVQEIYKGKNLTQYIAYQKLSREDKITVCIILIKTLMKKEGSYLLTPDHYTWLSISLKYPPEIGDHRCEKELFQFINITNFLHFQHLSKKEYMIDLILEPLSSMCGAAISGFCIFPLIESICRRRSLEISISGILFQNIDYTIRGTRIKKKKGQRISNIQHQLLLLEKNLDDFLSKSLAQLDKDEKIYKKIREARNSQLHGEFLGRADSIIFNLFLHLFYL